MKHISCSEELRGDLIRLTFSVATTPPVTNQTIHNKALFQLQLQPQLTQHSPRNSQRAKELA